ncbi:alpha/beta hydrolase [Pseudomonas cavernae]|uniref:Alpha/beta hydrolase n=1 Tax=Pseudomonas cavernae TaxID=2320867 RepID=A0A385Z1E5_9PSED|nr:alpha/beta hydrolase [Pseudomonas cavernae]AYC31442.1 alpha/beta hydrolase [Pseudomonas cavernae]
MPELTHQLLAVNGISLSLYSAGPEQGRPVWLLHGFPECWHSWRGQIEPLARAGYRVLIPEMRGYGQSSAPAEPQAYELLTLCADIQAAMDALGQTEACVVGHDWGAPVAWHLGLLEPQRVKALATLSVPFGGRPKRPAIDIMREVNAGRFNYILYFQEPGVAEAELDADIARSLRLILLGSQGEAFLQDKPEGAGLLDGLPEPQGFPAWCGEDDFAYYQRALARGFRGPLNWYRNFTRNWQRSEFLAGQKVLQPTLFLLGDRDPVGKLETHTLKRMAELVPALEQHLLPGCGHWIQNERAPEVNALLLDFLARHYPAA